MLLSLEVALLLWNFAKYSRKINYWGLRLVRVLRFFCETGNKFLNVFGIDWESVRKNFDGVVGLDAPRRWAFALGERFGG